MYEQNKTPNKMTIDMDGDHNRPKKGSGPPKNRRRKAFRTLLIVFLCLLAAVIGCVVFVFANIAKIRGDLDFDGDLVVLDETDDEAADLPEVTFNQGNVTQITKGSGETDILLIGVDNREDKFSGRSDVMMYLRVNTKKNTIKLVSFMRDTLVNIDGHGRNRLNTAYVFGSIDLAEKTYAESFGLTPDYYMVVNFFGMEDIIDALGGVDVTLESNELSNMNTNIDEANNMRSGDSNASHVTSSGMQHLTGRQAVGYMRVRHPGGDAARIQRQQNVLNALFSEMQNLSAGEVPGLVSALSQYVRTDLDLNAMVELATSVKAMSRDDLQTFRYPDDYKNGNYKGMSIVQPSDFDTEFAKLTDFLGG